MKNAFKLFDFMGTPVYLKHWFFALLIFVNFDVSIFISAFIAILIHELAHTYVAKKFNHSVDHVFLSLFAGGAIINTTYSSYRDTILIVGAGPVSNLILALLSFPFHNIPFMATFFNVNIILFIFNMLPIFPMDGGRISKAICQSLTKPSLGRKINGVIGIICSLLLVIFAMYSAWYIMAIFAVFFIYLNYKEVTQLY